MFSATHSLFADNLIPISPRKDNIFNNFLTLYKKTSLPLHHSFFIPLPITGKLCSPVPMINYPINSRSSLLSLGPLNDHISLSFFYSSLLAQSVSIKYIQVFRILKVLPLNFKKLFNSHSHSQTG